MSSGEWGFLELPSLDLGRVFTEARGGLHRKCEEQPVPGPPHGEVVTVAVQGYQLPTRLTV